MAGLPYMKFHFGDYFLDTGHLTCLQHGLYFQLIARYFTRGEALPDDDKYLANLVGLGPREWAKNRESVAAFFRVSGGKWFHRRVESEIANAEAKVLQTKAASRAAVERRMSGRSAGGERAITESKVEEESPSSTIKVEEERAGARDHRNGKKVAKPSLRYEFESEEPIMATVREELGASIGASRYAAYCDPARPISFVREEGRLVGYCGDGFTHTLVRDDEFRLSQIAKRHGFAEAWIREKPQEGDRK